MLRPGVTCRVSSQRGWVCGGVCGRGLGSEGGDEVQGGMTPACPSVGSEERELWGGCPFAHWGGRWAPFLLYSM